MTEAAPVGEATPEEAAPAYLEAQSAETQRLYAADWKAFVAWCQQKGQVALPAEPSLVAAFLANLVATLAPGALARRAAAIADQHR